MNPPYSMMDMVVEKLKRERPRHALIICPRWTNTKWYKDLIMMSDDRLVLPKGMLIFETNEKEVTTPAGPTHWDVEVVKLVNDKILKSQGQRRKERRRRVKEMMSGEMESRE
jgi:hypothetical protein